MDPDLDAIVRRLAEVVDDLNALPDGDFAARFRLLTERDDLRERAAAFRHDWDADRSTEDLVAELGAQRARLGEIHGSRIEMVTQAGGGTAAGSGADGMGGVVLNQGIDRAQGADGVRARIAALEAVLAGRGIDPDTIDHT